MLTGFPKVKRRAASGNLEILLSWRAIARWRQNNRRTAARHGGDTIGGDAMPVMPCWRRKPQRPEDS
jgi:hypothetical protein